MSRGKPPTLAWRRNHEKIYTVRGKASAFICIEDGCGRQASDWTWTHDTDASDPNNYKPRCRSCHGWYDQSKLNKENMAEICKHYGTLSPRKLGLIYGVDKNTIKRVWHKNGLPDAS